jgi:hypothetical protein
MAEVFNRDLLFRKRQISPEMIRYKKGEYLSKYYLSEDKVMVGKDGQHVRMTFNDFTEVIEIFPLAKPTAERYDDYFQRSYGKWILSSKNIISTFNVKYHNRIVDAPVDSTYSLNMQMGDYNVLYSEKSVNKIQNMVLGQEIINVLEDVLKVIDTINVDIQKHVHTNVSTPVIWRTAQIKKQIDTIKEYLPNILSKNNFLN